MCSQHGQRLELDARTSDAVALAVRFKCPIYTYEFILSSAGIVLDDKQISEEADNDEGDESFETTVSTELTRSSEEYSVEELEDELKKALEREDYEQASRLRDEINRRKDKN